MATHPRLVNKQFNSPIGLYSAQNVQEVLEREAQILANGAIGINFHNPDVGKPANLKNSAVLRMLEEEENRQRNGIGPGNDHIARPLRENITWPPPEYEHKNSLRSTFKDVVIPGAKRVAWPPPNESGLDSPYVEQNSVSSQGGPQYPSQSPGLQQNNYQAPAQQQPVSYNPPSHRPLKPLDVSTGGTSPLASPLVNQSPQGFRPATPSKGWAPVHSPVTTPTQPSWQQQYSPSVAAAPSQSSWQQSAPSSLSSPSIAAPTQPSWRQSAAQPQQQHQQQQQQQQHTSSTHFQAAHQSVSQHTYLGQQYAPTSFHPPQQQQYQPPKQQYQAPPQQQSPQQQYQPPQQQYQPPQQQYQPPQQQYQPPQQQYQSPQQQYQSPQQQYQPPQQQYQPPQQQYQPPQQQYQAPQQQYQPPQQQYQNQVPPQQYQTSSQQYQASTQQFQPSTQQNQAPQSSPKLAAAPSQVAAPRVQSAPAAKSVEPPPSTITLRQNAPVSQAPPPVVTSQPATATLKGGKHLRGDLKWPPENVKIQVEEENRLRLELAKGPAFRPRRPNKDYTEFFEQHALNSTYPGYKIPPGTQFYRPV